MYEIERCKTFKGIYFKLSPYINNLGAFTIQRSEWPAYNKAEQLISVLMTILSWILLWLQDFTQLFPLY